MLNLKEIIIPTESVNDLEVATTFYRRYSSDPNIGIFLERYLFDERMKSFWFDLRRESKDSYMIHLFFFWMLNSIKAWSEVDFRSKSEKIREIKVIEKSITSLRRKLLRQKDLFTGLEGLNSIISRKRALGGKFSEEHFSNLSTNFNNLIESLNQAVDFCNSRQEFFDLYKKEPSDLHVPSHTRRPEAFRNYMIDEVDIVCSDLFESLENKNFLVSQLVSTVSDVDTSEDVVRMRIFRN